MGDGRPLESLPWGELAPSGLARLLVTVSRNTPLGRGTPRKWLFGAFSRLHEGPVDFELWGIPVRLHPAQNVTERKILMRPDHVDRVEHDLLRAAMRPPGSVFLDIGANAGLYSLDAALSAGQGSRIVAIEPDPALLARLEFNLRQAEAAGHIRADVRVTRLAVAVGDHDGEAVLSTDGDEGSRSLLAPGGGRTVPLRSLSGLVAELGLPRIDVLKIDVEGYEDKVLPPYFRAAPPALRPRLMIVEHLSRARWAEDCISHALAIGYRQRQVTRNNTVLELPLDNPA